MTSKNITIIFLLLSVFTFSLSCQNKDTGRLGQPLQSKISIIHNDSIYSIVDEMPRFPGCEHLDKPERKACAQQKMLQYLYKKMSYDPIAKENGIVGTIVASFVIEKNGTVNNIEILKGDGQSNIIEVLENMPLWIPGTHQGIAKRVRFNIPFKIHWR